MRFRLTAKARSRCRMPARITFSRGQYHIDLKADASGYLSAVSVSAPVENYQEFLPRVSQPKDSLPTLSFRAPPVAQDLLELLQYLESMGGFYFDIYELGWHSATQEWLGENEEERKLIEINNVSVGFTWPNVDTHFSLGPLYHVLDDRARLAWLTIPFAFLREGQREMRAGRSIMAFFQFYFFLEGLFAGGKFRARQVEHEFLRSRMLQKSAADALQVLAAPHNAENRQDLLGFFKRYRTVFDAPGILRLLVRLRGDLHHFSLRRSQVQGHPLNQRQYHAPAYLTMTVCMGVVPVLLAGKRPA